MFYIYLTLYAVASLTCIGVTIAGAWATFAKANRPGWACLVPIYGNLVFIDIAGKPWWWLLLCMIPLAGIYFAAVLVIDFCRNYGKGVGFAIGMMFLPFAFLPLLGFDESEYRG